ncbi:transcriptional repressor [Flavobacterium sp. EDS]|uniref:Fur family transcriptional regulator n=1 Tax=Flavobacterium sp. EDS TaxID=2897328 RepID=UPI001E315CA3|nr:transcriptional repressor [Flavobacterium sp. EDS]MCD0476223.1 transcriptional repressor [Flavobacterium sp. EDS]
MKDLEKKLLNRNIKPTAVRLLIFNTMTEFKKAFSLTDLETELETVNKSTIFRTLTLFHENLLIHTIDDGSGSMKYSICMESCMCTLGELHVHFNCNHCHNTYCLESISIPPIQLPEKFLLESVNFVMKGICENCSQKSHPAFATRFPK